MAVSWFPNTPPYPGTPNWEYSANSGGSYAPYTGTNFTQLTGPTGTQRFRRIFTVPVADAGKRLQLNITGDNYDNSINAFARVLYDGMFIGTLPVGTGVVTTPVLTTGPHTIEV